MSDHIRLSLWFSTHTEAEILPHLADVARVLPAEALERGVRQLAVTALDWNEPALIEERFESGGIPLEAALAAMRDFAQPDCACELELAWLLWRYDGQAWEQVPHPLVCTSFGSDFAAGLAAQEGHVVVDFGLDEAFLAELAPWDAATRGHLQANILQLLAFSLRLQNQLQPLRRRLWSDTEADWSQKLLARLPANGETAEGDPRVQ